MFSVFKTLFSSLRPQSGSGLSAGGKSSHITRTGTIDQKDFLRSAGCSLALYRRFYRGEPAFDENKTFSEAALYARKLFPGAIDLSALPGEEARRRTACELQTPNAVLIGAAFEVGGIQFRTEIMEKGPDETVLYYTSSSVKGKRKPLREAALHENLLFKSDFGIKTLQMILLRPNGSYVRARELDLNRLFVRENLGALLRKNGSCGWMSRKLDEFELIRSGGEPEKPAVSEQCFSPSACLYFRECWGLLPENSVFEISGLTLSDKVEMFRRGDVKQEKINPENYPALTHEQKIQIHSSRQNKPVINRARVEKFLRKVVWPVRYIDFECIRPAVPLFPGMRPGEYIPFQYSLHMRHEPGGRLESASYLARAGFDPRREFAERLLEDSGTSGTIFVYGKEFELERIRELAARFPAHAPALEAVARRIVDLAEPFKEKSYYAPRMRGSYSIKSIAPALVPGLSYEDLEIKNGLEAMRAYDELLNPEIAVDDSKVRSSLLEYCRMDTLALVKLHDILSSSI